MSVTDPRAIDAIGISKSSQEAVLTISDHLEWREVQEHLNFLQEKINCYLGFVESGELEDAYPEAVGRRRRIEVVFKCEPPDSVALGFLAEAASTLRGVGLEFGWRTLAAS